MIALILVACHKEDGTGSDSGSTTPPPTTDPPTDTDTPTTDPPTDTDTPTDSGTDPLPTGLTGTVPPVALAAPVFSGVQNRDGTPRSQFDLVGHPTVMWFYPAANTGG